MNISRRNFIILGAAAAAGCATTPRPVPTVAQAPAVNIGIIGCGRRGRELAAAVAESKVARVAAVADACNPRCQETARQCGAAVRHWQDLVAATDIDGVMIATPDHLHAPIALAAMEAGKDVYCERPMALSLADARAFRDTAARSRRIVQIGAQQAGESQWHMAREIIARGDLGELRWSQGRYCRCGELTNHAAPGMGVAEGDLDWAQFAGAAAARPFDEDRFVNWRKYSDYSGGVAWSDLYWKLAALLVAVDAQWPERVSAAGGIYTTDGREVPDCFVLNAEFPGRHTIVLASSMAGERDRPAMIRGEQAAIEFNGDSITLIGDGGYGEQRVVPVEPRPTLVEEWLQRIQSRAACTCDEQLGYRATAILAMATEAYNTKKTVMFDPASEVISIAPHRA